MWNSRQEFLKSLDSPSNSLTLILEGPPCRYTGSKTEPSNLVRWKPRNWLLQVKCLEAIDTAKIGPRWQDHVLASSRVGEFTCWQSHQLTNAPIKDWGIVQTGASTLHFEVDRDKLHSCSKLPYSDCDNLGNSKYEPQYGGWCAYAMGVDGSKVEINPETYKILDNKLYLFYNAFFTNTLPKWNENESNLKIKADTFWTNIIKN